MRFGLFSNSQRYHHIAHDTYKEDLNEIILADQLGFEESWISEHGTFVSYQAPDQLPCADLFICKAAALTKKIRLAPGIRALPFFHPLQVATDCAVCDHLTDGRYMAGFGLGSGGAKYEPRGTLPGSPRDMGYEAVELIVKAWTSTEPFDWNGRFWQGKNWQIIPKPLTQPHMDVGFACSASDRTLQLTAKMGFLPIFSWHQTPFELAKMIETYLAAPSIQVKPVRSRVRVSRFIYVTDSLSQTRRDLQNCDVGAAKLNRLNEYIPKRGCRDDLTMDHLIDEGVFFCGDPQTVTQRIKQFYQDLGGFGTLLLVCGKDWGTWEQRQRSWQLLMNEVAPHLNELDG